MQSTLHSFIFFFLIKLIFLKIGNDVQLPFEQMNDFHSNSNFEKLKNDFLKMKLATTRYFCHLTT